MFFSYLITTTFLIKNELMKFKKKILILSSVILYLQPKFTFAQIGIGTTNPHPSSILEIRSTQKGFLPPRVNNTSSIDNPAEGLIVYDISDHCINVYNANQWVNICALNSTSSTNGTIAGLYQTCDEAGLVNPKQVETAENSAQFPTSSLYISSDDKLWYYGKDYSGIDNRYFNYVGHTEPTTYESTVGLASQGNIHRVSSPRQDTLVPTKIIAAYPINFVNEHDNINMTDNGLHAYLVEFNNNEQWWYLPFNTSKLRVHNNQYNSNKLNTILLCGDDLDCTDHSNTHLNNVPVPIQDRLGIYNWVRMVTPSGTKVKNYIAKRLTNNHAKNGAFILLDDNRIIRKSEKNYLFPNVDILSAQKGNIKQIRVLGPNFLTAPTTLPINYYIYILYDNGELYQINSTDYTSPPTLVSTAVKELSNDGQDILLYIRNNNNLFCTTHSHPNLQISLGINDVDYFTTSKTHQSPKENFSYYSTSKQLMYLLRSSFTSTAIRNDHPNAVLDDIYPTLPGQTNYSMQGVDYATTSSLRTVVPPNVLTNPPNVKYGTGVNRLFYKRGTHYGIHTNKVFVIEKSRFRDHFLPSSSFSARELLPLQTCFDITLPFDNRDSFNKFYPLIIYGD